MKLAYSKKILLLSITILIVTLVLDFIFINLLLGKIININNKVKQLDISSQEREKELNLRDSIANTTLEREKLESYFVGAGNAETVEFTKYLENLANEAGVSHKTSLDYEPVNELVTSDVISSIRYKFNVSGKWDNVFNFIQAVENLPKVALLNNISLVVGSEAATLKGIKSGNRIWSVDLDFSVVKLKN